MARPPAGPPPVAQSNAVQRSERKDMQVYVEVAGMLRRDDRRADLLSLLGTDEMVERFMAVALHDISDNSDLLLNSDPLSIVLAIKEAAALGLNIDGREGAIWRFNHTASFVPMYQGFLKRIQNSRLVPALDCQVVYMNDDFDIRLGTDPMIHHIPKLVGERDSDGQPLHQRGDYRGVYAWATTLQSDAPLIEYMTTADVNAIRDGYSPSVKANKASPWDSSWSEMARKTVIKRLCKRLPQAAVGQLLAYEQRLDELASRVDVDVRRMDVSGPRNAALAATTRRRNAPWTPAAQAAIPATTAAPAQPTATTEASSDEPPLPPAPPEVAH